MPIYEFKCQKCEEFFELLVFNRDDEVIKCPKCGAQTFERVMSRTNFKVPGGSSSCDSAGQGGAGVHNRTCSSGSCTTYTIPGDD